MMVSNLLINITNLSSIKLASLNEFLNTGNELYHFTSWLKLVSILESNMLKSNKRASDSDTEYVELIYKDMPYICLTRNKDLGFSFFRITLNKSKIENNYKIIKYDFGAETKYPRSEAEERVYTWVGIKNIKSYIMEISILSKYMSDEEATRQKLKLEKLAPNIPIIII